MTDATAHAAACGPVLARHLAPAGVAPGDFHVLDLAFSSIHLARSHTHAARYSCDCWGPMLETQRRSFTLPLDLSHDPETSALRAVEHAREMIDQQLALAAVARAAGVDAPIPASDARRIDHLDVDRDAFASLVELRGARGLADWIADQFEMRHRLALDHGDELSLDPEIGFEGATLVVPLLFEPLRIGTGYGEPGGSRRSGGGDAPHTIRPVWHGERMVVDASFPETVRTAAVGRPFEDVYPGTPVGRRPIAWVERTHLPMTGFPDIDMTTFHLQPDRVRLADVLPS